MAAFEAASCAPPRMDAQHDDAEEIATNITEPRVDIAGGYEAKLMPTDYASKMTGPEIQDLTAFIKAASTTGEDRRGGDGDDG